MSHFSMPRWRALKPGGGPSKSSTRISHSLRTKNATQITEWRFVITDRDWPYQLQPMLAPQLWHK